MLENTVIESAARSTPAPRLTVAIAQGPGEIREALQLRYAVFAEEMGAQLDAEAAQAGVDVDEFDAWCDHLVVREGDSQQVIGTYLILPPERARVIGRLYSDREFDLERIAHLRPRMVEVGRACIAPAWRQGPAILMLWAGLAHYMRRGGYTHMTGCASVSLAGGAANAAAVRDELMTHHRVPPEQSCSPRLSFPHHTLERAAHAEIPALLKGYLRLGARIAGDPAWDPDFNTADFLILLALADLPPRYARHFHLLVGDPVVAAA